MYSIDPLKTAARWMGNCMSHHLADGLKLRRMMMAKELGLKVEDASPFPAMNIENKETVVNKGGSGLIPTAIAALTTGTLLGGLGLGLLTNNNLPRPPIQEAPVSPIVAPSPQKFKVRFYDKNGKEIKVEEKEEAQND